MQGFQSVLTSLLLHTYHQGLSGKMLRGKNIPAMTENKATEREHLIEAKTPQREEENKNNL